MHDGQQDDAATGRQRLDAEITERFGLLPNFFRLAPQNSAAMARMWEFARFAYLDSPLPSLWKERLFVYLSRFCEVRYCITRHVGFLVGLGHPAGDADCPPLSVDDVLRLVRRPFARGEQLESMRAMCAACPVPLERLPAPDSPMDEAIFACVTHAFVPTSAAPACLDALRRALGETRLQHLLVFLSFVRTAHYWTRVHSELALEDDVGQLLSTHEALAQSLLDDPEAGVCEIDERVTDELAHLRESAQRHDELRRAHEELQASEAKARQAHAELTERMAQLHAANAAVQDSRRAAVTGMEDAVRAQFRVEQLNSELRSEVAERERAAAALREARSRLESTLSAGEVGTWEFDVVGNVVQADANLARMFSVTAEQAAGAPIEVYLRAVHRDDRDRVIETVRRALEAGDGYEADYRLVDSRGGVRWVVARGRVERDATGRAVRMPGVVVNITAQRQAEADLRASEEQRRLALDAARLGSWNIDPTTNLLVTDDRFRIIFCGSLAPLTYEQAFAAIHRDDRERVRDAVAAATRPDDRVPYSEEYRVVHPDGSVHWVLGQGRANFERTPTGRRLKSFDGTVMDITSRKRDELERERLLRELQQQDQRKDEFLATLAHELRNPLAPIRTGLQVLKLTRCEQSAAEAREVMDRQLTHMVRLVDDLLDVSRVNRGAIDLKRVAVDVRTVVEAALEVSRPLIEGARHALSVQLPEEPLPLHADPTRLAQVVSNLLNNASKYTPEGGRIELAVLRDEGGVVIRVRDDGVGVPADMLASVFDLFTQVGHSLDRAQGGLGIGLSLVRKLVGLHGGTVRAESAGAGRGSTFSVWLPLATGTERPAPATPAVAVGAGPPLSCRRILIVDDHVDGAVSMAMLLGLAGHETRVVHTGPDAIAAACEFRPQVVLLDIGLPGMNGYEVARRLRGQPGQRAMLLVALTGWGSEDDRRRSKEAGFDHHLTKPVEYAALQRLLHLDPNGARTQVLEGG